jgi:hypothetical protein
MHKKDSVESVIPPPITIAPRALARALRFFAAQADFITGSPDADPEMKSAAAAYQAQFERDAYQLERSAA